jgi:hypothetical protein
MDFLRSMAGYTRKEQIRNTRIREELAIFNINNKILKSRSNSEGSFNIHPKRRRNNGRPQIQRRTNILFKKAEQAKHGLIHEGDDALLSKTRVDMGIILK